MFPNIKILMKTKERGMTIDSKLRQGVAGLCLALLAGSVYAAEGDLNLALPANGNNNQASGIFMLAANDTSVLSENTGVKEGGIKPAAEFEPPLFSGSNAHQYLGLGTILLAGLTGMTAPEEGCESNCPNPPPPRDVNGAHAKLAYATVAMATATVVTGVFTHWDDFALEDGWTDPDNLHVLLGTAGAALMGYATYKSAQVTTGQVSHAGTAIAGAAGMTLAIALTW
jgi:hypothetical protein